MNLKIYDNKIAAPVKHGTRFLDKIFSTYVDAHIETIYQLYTYYRKREPIWIVYRDPMEHLVSALHTEILNRKSSNLTIADVISNFVRKEGTTHWEKHVLKELYYVWNKRCNESFNIVELKKLSNLLIQLGYEVPEYDYEEFQFHHLKGWVSKEDIVSMVQADFPKEWEYLMSIVESENEFYYKLNNKIITEIETPKIKFI
jgi:hypothetical protein